MPYIQVLYLGLEEVFAKQKYWWKKEKPTIYILHTRGRLEIQSMIYINKKVQNVELKKAKGIIKIRRLFGKLNDDK